MSIKPEHLPGLLQRSLAPAYLIAGTEPLLVQECRDQVIQAAHAQGFTERSVCEAGKNFDWDSLGEHSAAPTLFAARRILDLRLPTGKPGTDGSKALVKLAQDADPDLLLLVTSGDWGTAMRKLKWVTELSRAGVLVEVWPVKPAELPGWIRQRMKAAGLDPEPAAVGLLAELVEGNLLAAQQEIDKLLLLNRAARVTLEDVTRSVSSSARFDSFRLVDCALQGALGECLRVAAGLQRTGVPIQAVTGAMYRELSLAAAARSAITAGESESAVFGRLRVWPARQAQMRRALGRLSAFQFDEVFRALGLIDRQSKGRAPGDAWQALDRLLWFLCDPSAVDPLR
ncbi:MAG TPA: DNA polymerase III subunit delta [Xanthomonadales bacterium]|nr:DNA polymerase III subunit delta [Xanthomonadales bacterium]